MAASITVTPKPAPKDPYGQSRVDSPTLPATVIKYGSGGSNKKKTTSPYVGGPKEGYYYDIDKGTPTGSQVYARPEGSGIAPTPISPDVKLKSIGGKTIVSGGKIVVAPNTFQQEIRNNIYTQPSAIYSQSYTGRPQQTYFTGGFSRSQMNQMADQFILSQARRGTAKVGQLLVVAEKKLSPKEMQYEYEKQLASTGGLIGGVANVDGGNFKTGVITDTYGNVKKPEEIKYLSTDELLSMSFGAGEEEYVRQKTLPSRLDKEYTQRYGSKDEEAAKSAQEELTQLEGEEYGRWQSGNITYEQYLVNVKREEKRVNTNLQKKVDANVQDYIDKKEKELGVKLSEAQKKRETKEIVSQVVSAAAVTVLPSAGLGLAYKSGKIGKAAVNTLLIGGGILGIRDVSKSVETGSFGKMQAASLFGGFVGGGVGFAAGTSIWGKTTSAPYVKKYSYDRQPSKFALGLDETTGNVRLKVISPPEIIRLRDKGFVRLLTEGSNLRGMPVKSRPARVTDVVARAYPEQDGFIPSITQTGSGRRKGTSVGQTLVMGEQDGVITTVGIEAPVSKTKIPSNVPTFIENELIGKVKIQGQDDLLGFKIGRARASGARFREFESTFSQGGYLIKSRFVKFYGKSYGVKQPVEGYIIKQPEVIGVDFGQVPFTFSKYAKTDTGFLGKKDLPKVETKLIKKGTVKDFPQLYGTLVERAARITGKPYGKIEPVEFAIRPETFTTGPTTTSIITKTETKTASIAPQSAKERKYEPSISDFYGTGQYERTTATTFGKAKPRDDQIQPPAIINIPKPRSSGSTRVTQSQDEGMTFITPFPVETTTTVPKSRDDLVFGIGFDSRFNQKSRQDSRQQQQQQQETVSTSLGFNFGGRPPRLTKEPRTKVPNTDSEEDFGFVTGYVPFVKTSKGYKAVSKALPKGQAISYGAYLTDVTLSKSFKVVPTRGVVKAGKKADTSILYKFRPPKRASKGAERGALTFVERDRFALEPNEQGIIRPLKVAGIKRSASSRRLGLF